MVAASCGEDLGGLAVRVGHHDRDALVPTLAQGRHQGDLAEQGHAEVVGELLAAARAEQLVAGPVVAGEPAHVLDDAPHRQLQLPGGVGGALGHPLGGRLGGRDHEDLGLGQVLAEGQGHVAGARRHVDQEEVGLAPVGVDEELLERLVQHRAPPDDRRVVGHEEAHGQAAHAVGRRRDDEVADDQGVGPDAEHLGHREPVDVGVEDADVVAGPLQRDGQVDRHRGLADPALAGRDPEDAGLRPGLHELVGPTLLVPEGAALAVVVPVVVPVVGGVHRAAVDGVAPQQHPQAGPGLLVHQDGLDDDLVHPADAGGRGPDPGDELVDLRVLGDRQGHVDRDLLALGHDPPDHAQLPQRASELGVVHVGDRRRYLGLVNGHCGLS